MAKSRLVLIIIGMSVALSVWGAIFFIGKLGYIDITWTPREGLSIKEGLSHACRTMNQKEFKRLCILRGVKVED